MKAAREQDLVAACLTLLSLRGVFAWRNNSGAFVLGQGQGRRFFRAGLVGSADILGLLPPAGRFLALECKVGRNKPTAQQAAFLAAVEAAGGLSLVVYDVAELVRLLDGLSAAGRPRRGAATGQGGPEPSECRR
jgi:hypothetical protein